MGRVCAIHNEYCPDGECRWCEPLEGLRAVTPAKSIFGINNPPPVIGGYYDGCDLMPTWNVPEATGAVPAVHQANGLVLPARDKPPTDPTLRADVAAAWDASFPPGGVTGSPF